MSEITIKSAYKVGSRELRSGDFIIQFQVDQTLADQLLPLHLIKQDKPLSLVITDGEPKEPKTDETMEREKLYASIEIHAKSIGFKSENQKRGFFAIHTGKSHKKEMDLDQLQYLERKAFEEANPVPVEN